MQVVASETIDLPRATAGAWQATAASLSGPAAGVIRGMTGETGHRNSLLRVLEGKVIISIFCHREGSVSVVFVVPYLKVSFHV